MVLYLVLSIGLVIATPLADDIWGLMMIWLVGPVVVGFVVERSWVLLLPFIPPPVVLVYERLTETSHGEIGTLLFFVRLSVFILSFGTVGMLLVIGGKGLRHAFDAVWGKWESGRRGLS